MARIRGVWYPDSAKSRYIFLKTLEEDNSALYLSAISELNLINGENSKDFQDKIDNTNLDGIKYGPSIDRSFDFEKSYDNAEWMLQQAEVKNEK